MFFFIQTLFYIFLLADRKMNPAYVLLVLLQILSFYLHYLSGRELNLDSIWIIMGLLFVDLNIYFILFPWRHLKIQNIYVKNKTFFSFYKKYLYIILGLNLFFNIIILVVVMIFFPDVATFKLERGFTELYDRIPYFGFVFRYAAISQNFGYLAIPFALYYMGSRNMKKALIALFLSSSTLISAFAFYSRSQIVTYILLLICAFYMSFSTLPKDLSVKYKSYINKLALGGCIVLFVITFIRFSSEKMAFYGDNIPKESLVKDPGFYSIIDYGSQGFVNCMDYIEYKPFFSSLYGEPLFYDYLQMLSFFNIIEWSVDGYVQRMEKVVIVPGLHPDNDTGAFRGHVGQLASSIGYIMTFILDFWYFIYLRLRLKKKSISLELLTKIILLLLIPIVSIFYAGFSLLLAPLFLYIIIKVLFLIYKIIGVQ